MTIVKVFSIIAIICVTFLFESCSPQMIANAVVIVPKIVKSETARNSAQSLKNDSTTLKSDSINYASYYIYRNGSFAGSLLSCLVYDNNQFVAIANLKTFVKVDHVVPGDHIFTSKENSKKSVKIRFDPGKTYIVQVFATTTISKGVLIIMDQNKINKEISKGLFFEQKFIENGLKVEDFSNNNNLISGK